MLLHFSAAPDGERPGWSRVRLYDHEVVVDVRAERTTAQRQALERFLDSDAFFRATRDPDRRRPTRSLMDGGEAPDPEQHGFLKCASKVMWDIAESVDDRATFEWAVWHARWMVEATPGGRGYRSFVLGGETFEARVRELRLKKFGVEE